MLLRLAQGAGRRLLRPASSATSMLPINSERHEPRDKHMIARETYASHISCHQTIRMRRAIPPGAGAAGITSMKTDAHSPLRAAIAASNRTGTHASNGRESTAMKSPRPFVRSHQHRER